MSATNLKVKIFNSDGTQVVPVAKSNLTIGSAKHCEVVLNHPSVHGEHLRAWFDSGRIWIQDMGSANGTFINGIRLPALKPMLVRELDVLKIGDNPATIGLEASLVRAPVVRTQAGSTSPSEEVTSPGRPIPKDSELEKKRDELAKIRREIAELKLQLQMAKLDKNSEDEAHRQLSMMRNEINGLMEQKVRAERAIKQMEQQRQSQLSALEKEINDRKSSAMNQLKNLMDHEMSKLADWKMQTMASLRRDIHEISEKKAKVWVTRPLSKDMILEWESEIQTLLRSAILGEMQKEETPSEPMAIPDSPPSVPRAEFTKTGVSASGVSSSSLTRTPVPKVKRGKLRKQKTGDVFKMTLMFTLVSGLVVTAFLVKRGVIGGRTRSITYVTETSGSSVQSPPSVAASPNRPKYEPKMTKSFKKTYTDNVLFTEGFLDGELNSSVRTQWLVDLNKAALNDWKLDSATVKIIADKEFMLIQDLKRLRDAIDSASEKAGIQAMRERESVYQKELSKLLKGRVAADKITRLKKSFFARQQSSKTR